MSCKTQLKATTKEGVPFSVDTIERRSVADALKNTGNAALSIDNKKHALWEKQAKLTYVFSAKKCTEEQFREACNQWTLFCDVSFRKTTDSTLAVFEVVDCLPDTKTIASSFFPSEDDRKLRCFEDLTKPPYNTLAVNILAHEVGHILGFRHEHIWLSPEELRQRKIDLESTNGVIPVTKYDADSIMNYVRLYSDLGSSHPQKGLSELDKIGGRKCYPY